MVERFSKKGVSGRENGGLRETNSETEIKPIQGKVTFSQLEFMNSPSAPASQHMNSLEVYLFEPLNLVWSQNGVAKTDLQL